MQRLKENNLVSSFRILANYGIAGSYPPAFEYQRTVAFNSFQGGKPLLLVNMEIRIWHLKRNIRMKPVLMLCFSTVY